jgi:hypothetical protein
LLFFNVCAAYAEGEAPGLLRRAITASQETAAGKAGAEAGRSGRWTLLRAAEEGAVERASHALQLGANVMLSLDGAVSPPSPALVALVARSSGPPTPARAPTSSKASNVVTTGMSSVAISPRSMLVLHLRGPNPAAPDALAPLVGGLYKCESSWIHSARKAPCFKP